MTGDRFIEQPYSSTLQYLSFGANTCPALTLPLLFSPLAS